MRAAQPAAVAGRPVRFNHTLEIWQGLDGVAPDGTRSYNERTVFWIADYLGWPTVILAMIGYCLLVIRARAARGAYPLTGMLTLGLAMSAVYLWNANITPDQPLGDPPVRAGRDPDLAGRGGRGPALVGRTRESPGGSQPWSSPHS